MKKIFSKFQHLTEKQVLISLSAIGTALFLTMFFLMPPTEVTEWEEIGVETNTVKTLGRSVSVFNGTQIYAVVELADGKPANIPIHMTDDIRAGDAITVLIEKSNEKKPTLRYRIIAHGQNRGQALK